MTPSSSGDQASPVVDDSGADMIDDDDFVHSEPRADCVGFCHRMRNQRISEHV
jgi:hypothetical protein